MKKFLSAIRRRANAFVAQALSALLWFFMLSLGGSALIVAGIHLLLGTAWALIAGGLFLIMGAVFVSRGMNNG